MEKKVKNIKGAQHSFALQKGLFLKYRSWRVVSLEPAQKAGRASGTSKKVRHSIHSACDWELFWTYFQNVTNCELFTMQDSFI